MTKLRHPPTAWRVPDVWTRRVSRVRGAEASLESLGNLSAP